MSECRNRTKCLNVVLFSSKFREHLLAVHIHTQTAMKKSVVSNSEDTYTPCSPKRRVNFSTPPPPRDRNDIVTFFILGWGLIGYKYLRIPKMYTPWLEADKLKLDWTKLSQFQLGYAYEICNVRNTGDKTFWGQTVTKVWGITVTMCQTVRANVQPWSSTWY
jgi:hypothetical protein